MIELFLVVYNVPVGENQSSKPVTLHLSQVVNRVSRCNYVLRRFVREAQKYSPKQLEDKRPASQPIQSKTFLSSQSHESKDIRLFNFEKKISFRRSTSFIHRFSSTEIFPSC